MKLLANLTTAFAVFGVVLGMVLGIISAAFNLKDEKTKRLTRWGKIGVVGIVLTAVLTIAAQFINSKQEEIKLSEARKDQATKLRGELDRFQQLFSQFQTTHIALGNISTSLSQENERSVELLSNMVTVQGGIRQSADTLSSLEKKTRSTANLLERTTRRFDNLIAGVTLQIPIGLTATN